MNSRRSFLFAATAALASPAAPALAQDDLIEVFTRDELHAALDYNGATYAPNEDGRTVDVTFDNSIKANAAVMACDDEATETNCYATSILSTFSAPEGKSAEDIETAINSFNYRKNFGRAYLDPNGTVAVRIYIISDGGIKPVNYATQIGLWAMTLEDFVGYLYEGVEETTGSVI